MNLVLKRDYFQSEEDLQRLVELQNITYADRGLHFSIQNFRYWYIENPLGRVISFNAYDGDKMVAHYACIPVSMNFEGKIISGIHSMATVTHPDYRGKGLFTKLAAMTYECAKKEGFEFVTGVANANSTPGFIKKLGFTLVAPLEVKWGIGKIDFPKHKDAFIRRNWDVKTLNWRLRKSKYSKSGNSIYGTYGAYPFIKTYMGILDKTVSEKINLMNGRNIFKPFNLYIGLGADLSNGLYFRVPKFIKRSPFNLIFLDLTGGNLPEITPNNIFFQLIDFDVA